MYRFRGHIASATRAVLLAATFSTSCANSYSTVCSNENVASDSLPAEKEGAQMHLKHVIVIFRHGDRAPVSRSIGPNYPQTKEIDDIWRSKLPSGLTENLLKGIARSQSVDSDDNLYNGRDLTDYPYGQLTEIGSKQCMELGSHLRRLYSHDKGFLPNVMTAETIYTRSTNICRTMNSLRSVLIGLYGINSVVEIEKHSFPMIRSYPTHHDPMIDSVTKDAEAKNIHRKHIFEKHSLPHGFTDFKNVNDKLKKCLGYPDRVNYHVIRENLVCNVSHGLALPVGLDEKDIEQQYELEMWVAGILYGDRLYNSHEIGCFMGELRDRLVAVQSGEATEKLSLYSAHDYTLIPLLIGLGAMPADFPFYATNLKIEIATKQGDQSEVSCSQNKSMTLARLLWNDKEISLPGLDVWSPIEEVIDRLNSGFLGIEDSLDTLNSMNEIDSVLNDVLLEDVSIKSYPSTGIN